LYFWAFYAWKIAKTCPGGSDLKGTNTRKNNAKFALGVEERVTQLFIAV